MNNFVEFKKLSKKEQKKANQTKRGSWNGLNPVTRVKQSGKIYNRKAMKCNVPDEYTESEK